jgi:hypothetical protein
MHKLSETSPYFSERYDATGHVGLTALQKCTAALLQLGYDMVIDKKRCGVCFCHTEEAVQHTSHS